MEQWIKVSLLLCTFGFFREMRPSEMFVTEFLSGEWRNVTAEQVNREIYPLGTYSHLAQLTIFFLITDMLRYKPIIVFSAIIGIVLWCLLLWTTSLNGLRLVQLCYGTFMAAEVAYYTYMYAKVERSKYQQVTGHARSAILAGRFLAAVLAQLLVSFDLMDLRQLNFISLGAQCVSLVWALLLPSVGISLYFYAPPEQVVVVQQHNGNGNASVTSVNQLKARTAGDVPANDRADNNAVELSELPHADTVDETLNGELMHGTGRVPSFSWQRASILLWSHFVAAYSNKVVVQWSLWWALAMCGFVLAQSYIQLLWQLIDPDQQNFYNGAVEAVLTLFGALGAFAAGLLDSRHFDRWSLWILAFCSALEGVLIVIAALTDSVWVAYIMYVLFGTLYHFMITVASGTVAKHLAEDSFALIFGINTLMALIFQSIMTVVFISDTGFGLTPRGQFTVFGVYFVVLAILFAIAGSVQSILKSRSTKSLTMTE